ncbi:MAG TPA: membrane protein insertion efficiency factor YidD [Syntrophales bacterium]|nr:membrane protein insertion efficiency factor YidD [Syntrophales bacterium]HQB30890.1 membrane protein insertion efficiency factor YidD [Syntrophales bacterium]HQN79309.1 membrane protein insertion efficiency factor YidD [Syntrophales bacterium]HQQ28473.1 membrane protein insertion efficiency factor YidD [Syntrophales bacterium]
MVLRCVQRIFVFLIRCYQVVLSPLFPASCRFFPTCSEYAVQAVELHGPFKGICLGLRRILRCHPFHPGGYDPVE